MKDYFFQMKKEKEVIVMFKKPMEVIKKVNVEDIHLQGPELFQEVRRLKNRGVKVYRIQVTKYGSHEVVEV